MLKAALGQILQQMEKAQEEIGKIQLELANYKVESYAGGGMVRVVANAKKEILEIKFDLETVTPDDVEMLEELTLAAVNQALEKADEKARNELQKAAGGVFGNFTDGLKLSGLIA
jgi:DNA-binding YbaB/EbfC family protein